MKLQSQMKLMYMCGAKAIFSAYGIGVDGKVAMYVEECNRS